MPLTLEFTNPMPASDPYAVFNTLYTRQLLDAFRTGARLSVWRRTTPWNYFLDPGADGDDLYIVGNCRASQELLGTSTKVLQALQALATHDEASKQRITGVSNFEKGLPEQEWWRYDADKAAAAEAAWAEAYARYKDWHKYPYVFNPQLSLLSEAALALLRTLRAKGGGLVYTPELTSDLEALRKQGLLVMHGNGLLALAPQAKRLRLPRGQQLAITVWYNR